MNQPPTELLPPEEQPRYRITTVSAMTGLSAPTLRAWERRYGIPRPTRDGNTYRLYSTQDVEIIKQMQSLRREGHAPSEAARLTKSALLTQPKSPLRELPQQVPPLLGSLQAVKHQLIEAIQRFDEPNIRGLLEHSIGLGSAWSLYQELIIPCLRYIGDEWEAGRLDVAQEHLFSEIAQGFLERLLRLLTPPYEAPTILLACVEDEQHELPLRGLALLASHQGWRASILGARTPPAALARAIELLKPPAVGLSMIYTHSRSKNQVDQRRLEERLQRLAEGYRKACGRTPWIIGGTGAQKHRRIFERAGGIVAEDDRVLTRFLQDAHPKFSSYQQRMQRAEI
ncbi:MAG: MerR family transcriptional regulator [Myxococcota bacterium]|nr:MerR family transcriptional regulator [Myxococcota bacterium]